MDVTAPDPLQLLAVDDVAALLQVKPSWVYDAAQSGRIRSIKVGRQLRFRRSHIEEYLGE